MVLFLCVCCLRAHECLFCYAFAWYMLCMRFRFVRLNSEEKREGVSIVSLSETGDSCKECSWIHLQGVRWWRLSSLTFVLIHLEVEVGCWSHARSAQAEEEVSVVNLSKGDLRLLLQECAKSKGFSWEVIECWAQGVHASSSERIRVENLMRYSTFVILLKESIGVCAMEGSNKSCKRRRWRASSEKDT